MSKYLDKDGVARLWSKVKTYVGSSIPTTVSWGNVTGKPDLALKSDIPEASGGDGGVPAGIIAIWSGSGDNAPGGWALCDGQNGTPDLRDRFVLGAGDTYEVGTSGGEAAHTLTTAEMPSHRHNMSGTYGSTYQHAYGKICVAEYENTYNGSTTALEGKGQAHNNMPPFYALCYIIKL